ncbi:ATP-dependent DNA helicase Q-like SIM isoform X2 [Dioscorea cayenensis subsp. rotundata]|uniref:ATP-dependent DNA helicase n=1 Tax=Dioscorea cayennensis subsp. rotundata TaxID=55577 RepID=A0AB40AGJ6_DIOCR|nr:ATP-dependent DNA helicase Q-like SIM isoform X2 [Dioscorea cayenensis subsp. rotundata]
MVGNDDVSVDHVIGKLIEMGFEFDKAVKATEAVGPCLDDALEFILNGSCDRASAPDCCSTAPPRTLGRRRLKQSNITNHVFPSSRKKRNLSFGSCDASSSKHMKIQAQFEPATISSQRKFGVHVEAAKAVLTLQGKTNVVQPKLCSSWERKVSGILRKHFGFSSLKSFQKEALEAWLANRDCLVLAGTGSGKSLCFQIPALLSGKIVVVISPLISLMHDQCLKLAKHGVSACFLGSGQPDSSVEHKAMSGRYNIVYVCPETVLRLVAPLKRLAESHGIALFAIDEAHCISKWGHDFRPDYRRLSALRENFSTSRLKFLKFDIPLIALTATATIPVREDIVKSLHMSNDTKIILSSFFRPNLRFSVKHSRTSSESSYAKDFRVLIETYAVERRVTIKKSGCSNAIDEDEDSHVCCRSLDDSSSDGEESDEDSHVCCKSLDDSSSDGYKSCPYHRNCYCDYDGADGPDTDSTDDDSAFSRGKNKLRVEYLEDELSNALFVDDFDVSCGEFIGKPLSASYEFCEALVIPSKEASLEQGPTIVYVPTRKETLKVAEYLSRHGVRAAAYHAKLPKSHLRRVHDEFHCNQLQVVVATIAFGMGIDKSNVRRIIHYGWPQSLEAYYQEAGRAGRDGKLSDCTLYVDLSTIPALLPSQRSEERTKEAYRMLSECFRYGMNNSVCRARMLVKYFGEELTNNRCHLCDVCVSGSPKIQNLKEEAAIFLRVVQAEYMDVSAVYGENSNRNFLERPNFKTLVGKIRRRFHEYSASNQLWWQGLARILEDKGYIREGDDDKVHVCIKYPEPTKLGLKFLKSGEALYACPEADMLLSMKKKKPYSSFSDWGRGWADPEIRRQRLQQTKSGSGSLKRKMPSKRPPGDSNKVKRKKLKQEERASSLSTMIF